MSGSLLDYRTPHLRSRRPQPGLQWPYIAPSFDEFDIVQFANVSNLSAAMRNLGGSASGIDNICVQDLSPVEWSHVLRAAAQQILTGHYRPNQVRKYSINKPSGGQRILGIPTVVDRTISKALQLAIQDCWRRQFPQFMISCQRTYFEFEQALRESGRRLLVTADITKCFPSVDIEPVLQAHQDYINNGLLLRLIEQVIRGHEGIQKTRGLGQGCPYSPAAMEVTLRSCLDEKWRNTSYQWHYVDNFTFLCETKQQGIERIEEYQSAIRTLGLTLRKIGIADVSREQDHQVEVLGLSPTWQDETCHWRIPESSWKKVELRLQKFHQLRRGYVTNPRRTTHKFISGLLNSMAPAFRGDSFSRIVGRMQKLLKAHGVGGRDAPWMYKTARSSRDHWLNYRNRLRFPPTPTTFPVAFPLEEGECDDSRPPF